MKLFYAPRTISVAVAIVLEHQKIEYEGVRIDFAKSEQTKPEYHEINPKGRVPALQTEGGILTETAAILEYIAPDMVPEDAFAAAKMRELMSYLNGTMHPHHAHAMRGSRWAREKSSFADMRAMVPIRMRDCAQHIEEVLPTLPFDPGSLTAVSDAYLYVVLSWLPGDGVDVSHYPRITAFQRRMNTHAAVQAVYQKGML
ncbi:MAG: glutathione S-transferase family protein [Pseudomonadota bacterium]